jgi:ribosomal protein S18 acetylase RimI-like enzyme
MNPNPNPVEWPIEPARPEDAPEAARLLIETDPVLYRFLYGDDLEATRALLMTQWQRHDCLLSHRLALVVRQAGRPLGLVLSYTAEEHEALPQFATIDVQDSVAGVSRDRVAAVMQNRASEAMREAAFLFPVVPAGALYVQNLAVVPEARGLGLGQRLMAAVFARAAALGCTACHLDVAANTPAVGFYGSLGMEVLVETRMPGLAERHGLPTHFRMIRAVTGLPDTELAPAQRGG